MLPATMVFTVPCPNSTMPTPLLPDTTLPLMRFGLATAARMVCREAE